MVLIDYCSSTLIIAFSSGKSLSNAFLISIDPERSSLPIELAISCLRSFHVLLFWNLALARLTSIFLTKALPITPLP